MGSGSGSVPEAYAGREQAFIKHELLKRYLEKLFFDHRHEDEKPQGNSGMWSVSLSARTMPRVRADNHAASHNSLIR